MAARRPALTRRQMEEVSATIAQKLGFESAEELDGLIESFDKLTEHEYKFLLNEITVAGKSRTAQPT